MIQWFFSVGISRILREFYKIEIVTVTMRLILIMIKKIKLIIFKSVINLIYIILYTIYNIIYKFLYRSILIIINNNNKLLYFKMKFC